MALLSRFGRIEAHERTPVLLAFACYFILFASYYILRPVRDTVATVFGAERLQLLFLGTFIGTMIASPLFGWLASRMQLRRLLPGVFWFWLLNVLAFAPLFHFAPQNAVVAAAYYIWFSVVNLFMISAFWSLMVDLFSAEQATRLFGVIAAGGSLGAIVGPLVTRFGVQRAGLAGLLLIAAAGFLGVIALFHGLMRAKQARVAAGAPGQRSRLDHDLSGKPWDGFRELFRSSYSLYQAAFMLLMTYVNTVAYFFQTEVIARSVSAVTGRAIVIADMDLAVNLLSALILILGLGRMLQRYGVTSGLLLNPLIMVVAFLGMALSPTLLAIQSIQVVRRVAQYAIARPSREICFTVIEQADRYKTKNVIDTVGYRFGDVSAAWIETALRAAGAGIAGASVVGSAVSALWGVIAVVLGRRYERLREASAR